MDIRTTTSHYFGRCRALSPSMISHYPPPPRLPARYSQTKGNQAPLLMVVARVESDFCRCKRVYWFGWCEKKSEEKRRGRCFGFPQRKGFCRQGRVVVCARWVRPSWALPPRSVSAKVRVTMLVKSLSCCSPFGSRV